jgi:hypothetical protein
LERVKTTKFEKGHRLSVGNNGPVAKQEVRRGRAALAWLLNCVDKDTGQNNWFRLWSTLFARALSGDTKASRLLLDYALGSPKQSLDITNREHIDEIPPITESMTLAEASATYFRALRATGRPGDGGNLDQFETPALPAPMSSAERTAAAGQSRVLRNR